MTLNLSVHIWLFFFLPPGGAITQPLQDVTVAESQTAELECQVANANAEGKWLKDGQQVDFNENLVSEADGAVRRLVIVITRPQDVGEYTYQVASSKTTAHLRVEGTSSALASHLWCAPTQTVKTKPPT